MVLSNERTSNMVNKKSNAMNVEGVTWGRQTKPIRMNEDPPKPLKT